ncbi:Ig-like domain-containing protein, partial [Pyxidicoccus sp. 3LG]
MQPRRARCLGALGVVLAVLVGVAPALAQGQATPSIVSVYPLRPLQAGAGTLELGFEVEGSASQVVVSVRGTSATAGVFVDVARTVVSRDVAGEVPFHVLVPLSAALPADGRLEISAAPVASEGMQVTPVQVVLDGSAPPPAFAPGAVKVRASPDSGELLVDVAYQGTLARVELTLLGASSELLRTVQGDLEEAEAQSFARVRRRVARPRLATPGKVTFAVPVEAERIPLDGVVVVDVALVDPFDRVVHTSQVEFTDSTAFDPVLGLRAGPSPLLLSEGFGQREPLKVFASFVIAGEVDVSGAAHGASYESSDESVAVVTRDGQVVAHANGEAVVTVRYAGYSTTVPVVVDSTAELERLSILPVAPMIPSVGDSVALRLEGVLTSGRQVDLTPAALGTRWSSEDPSTLQVSPDGKVTSLRPGPARIVATYPGLSPVSVMVEALDAAPQVRLTAPATVVAGGSLEIKAVATDDVGVARVDFLVNGVPTVSDTTPPFVLQVKAPPYGGGTLVLAARVVDTAGQQAQSAEARVQVTGARAPSSRSVVYEAPLPGQLMVAGLPQTLRVTSGDWRTSTLRADDFQSVRFTVDDAALGVAQAPRVEVRMRETDKGPEPVLVPLWEVTFVPSRAAAGTSAVIRAVAVDGSGAEVPVEALPVRIVADSAPLITLRQPVGPMADATVNVPLSVSGSVGDDALSFGVDVRLVVDGAVVASTRLTKGGVAGTPSGSQDFSFSWTPPASSLGKQVKVEVQAIDVGGNERRAAFQAVVRADQPPQVSILTPISQSSLVAGSRMVLTAATQDDSGRPVQVTWLINGAPVGLSSAPPYLTTFTVPATAAGQTFTVEAVARDSSGQEKKASATVFATPDVTPPSLAIVSPPEGAQVVRSQDLLVSVAGLDDVDVKRVELLLNGEVLHTDSTPAPNASVPGSFVTHAVIPAALLQGRTEHRLRARAYDVSDNVGFAPEVLVHAVADEPPTVTFTRPLAGAVATLGASLEVLVDAKDDVAIQGVALFLDGTAVGTRTLPPYRFEVPLSGAERSAVLRAVATDSGNRTTEATLPLELSADQKAPLVGFRAPAEGTRVFAGRTVPVEVVASDDVEVAWAELYLGATRVARISGGTQEGLYRVFRFQVAVPASAEGTRLSLRAVAADRSGLTAERVQELLAVRDLPPTVTLLAPPPGSPYREGEDVRLSVAMGDDEGVIGWVGQSGGVADGVLPVAGPLKDVASPQVVVVRAPIISQGQPDTVGITVRDTAGQDTTRTVSLGMRRDTQPPSALLTSPLPPREGLLEVDEGGSVGVRVEVRDDVRVSRVSVLVDGTTLTPGGREPLGVSEERFEEVRTPDPTGPGTILTSREYVGTFAGTVRLEGVAPGEHTLVARAHDPAGNVTDTHQVRFLVKEFVDSGPPRLSLALSGAPDDTTCVSGSTVRFVVTASDDGVVSALSASLDGEPLELSEVQPGASVRAEVSVVLPVLAAGETSRTLTFTARAVDATGKAAEASLVRTLRPDAAPT